MPSHVLAVFHARTKQTGYNSKTRCYLSYEKVTRVIKQATNGSQQRVVSCSNSFAQASRKLTPQVIRRYWPDSVACMVFQEVRNFAKAGRLLAQ